MRLRIEVSKLTPQDMLKELKVLHAELLRLDANNLRSLDTVQQAAAIILELVKAVDELRELIPVLNEENEKLTAMLEKLTSEGEIQ